MAAIRKGDIAKECKSSFLEHLVHITGVSLNLLRTGGSEGKAMPKQKPSVSRYWIFVPQLESTYWGSREVTMSLGYDIFRKLGDGSAVWMGQAATLAEAKEKVMTLWRTVPAKYFLRDANTGRLIEDPEAAE